ncbi:hypothetical protein ACIQNU_05600 [Streptomyces sp. NPDC091292]|uniref:hypothetical protein n=1 Tax=Streptomyces sp. NPDC091292 TaxID=3365991 RepID=UPI00382D8C85
MRDSIPHTLVWVLSVLIPRRPGRHTAEYLAAHTPEPAPVPASPWSRPWTAPSAQEVRAIFRDKRTQELSELQRERVWAAEFAALGLDYDFPTMPLGSLVKREQVAA